MRDIIGKIFRDVHSDRREEASYGRLVVFIILGLRYRHGSEYFMVVGS